MISSCFVCTPIDTSLLEVGEGEYILQYARLANGWDFPPGVLHFWNNTEVLNKNGWDFPYRYVGDARLHLLDAFHMAGGAWRAVIPR
jgi:hypothetical protein